MKYIEQLKRRIVMERRDAEEELKHAVEDYEAANTIENYVAVKNWTNVCLALVDVESIVLDTICSMYEEMGNVKNVFNKI